MIRLLCVLIGYAFGLIPTGLIIARCFHVNIRKSGSGNTGATNAMRVLGWAPGLLTFAGDSMKCVAAVLIARYAISAASPDMGVLLGMYAGLGAVLGHDFPFYLKFHGGKGVSTTSGLIFAIDPLMVPVPLAVFLIISIVTRYVSIASLAVMAILTAEFFIFGTIGRLDTAALYLPEIYAVMIALALLCVWQHRANIKRLASGSENKITIHKKKVE